MKRGALVLYIIALHVVCVGAIWKPGWIAFQKAKYGFSIPGEAHIASMRAIHARDDNRVTDGALIFLGDSITEGMRVNILAADAVNYGIGYQTSTQLIESMRNYRSLERAGAIHLNIGTNDVRDGTTERLSENYRRILAALPPATPLIWSAIIPRLDKDRPAIETANRVARTLCAARSNCRFIDTWKILATSDGRANAWLYADPVHLNSKGYALWFAMLRPHIAAVRGI